MLRISRNRLCGWLLVLILAGCQTPTGHLHRLAKQMGFDRQSIRSGGFDHLVIRNSNASARVLHVYLEGDGSPWRYRRVIMPDPTPRKPLMLKLMQQDPNPAVYLGRPCYNGTSLYAECNPALWTSGRYSTTVVASMTGVLRQIIERYQADQIRLFGHSGGGTLAMLIAEQLPRVSDVVTLAGNLDTDAWTGHHGYTPLYSSLNPARRPPLDERIMQWHLLGASDAVIPSELVRPFIELQASAVGVSLPNYNHGCCWSQSWSQILDSVTQRALEKLPGIRFK